MRARVAVWSLGLSLLGATALWAADPVLLQYKFEAKEKVKYKLTMKTEAKFQTPDGGTRNTTMQNDMELSQELIEKKEDGSFRIAVTIDKANQTIDGKPAQLPVAVGHSQLLTMMPNGQVTEGAADVPNQGGPSQMQMVFPDKPVAEKETWDQTSKIDQPIPLETTTKYSVDSLSADLPGYEGKVVAMSSKMAMENQKTPTGESVTSTTDGKIWFDAVKGRIVQTKASSTFKIAIPINLQNILPPNSVVKIDFAIDIDISQVK